MKRLACLAAAAMIGFAASDASALTNGGFETGNFNGWQTKGNTSVIGNPWYYGGALQPSEGNYQALLLNDYKSIDHIESFLGIDGLDDLFGRYDVEGSAIKQTFLLEEDCVLSFDWRFAVKKDALKSYKSDDHIALMVLDGELHILADSKTVDFDDTFHAFLDKYKVTDWATVEKSLSAGQHTIAFALLGETKYGAYSKLLVDNISMVCETVVPEPVTATLALLSVGALSVTVRRRRAV